MVKLKRLKIFQSFNNHPSLIIYQLLNYQSSTKMNITQKIIQFEWMRLKKSGLFKSLVLVLILFLTAAFYTGVRHDQFRKNSIQFIKDKEHKSHTEFKNVVAELERKNEDFKGNGHRDPSSPLGAANSTGNRTFFLPPTDLSFVTIGESESNN